MSIMLPCRWQARAPVRFARAVRRALLAGLTVRFACIPALALTMVLAISLTVAFVVHPGFATSPRNKSAKASVSADQFASAEKILSWISNYRYEPEPDKLPMVVHAMSRLNVLRDAEKSGVYVGFIAGVLGTNQLQATTLVAAMFPLPPRQQDALIRAIAYSGLPNWKGLMKHFVERMPARRVLIGRFLFGKEPVLSKLSLASSPAVLDAHWGYYFATGLYEPVTRIIDAMQWSTNKSDLQKLTIGSMAKWTLATNAARDKALLDLCRQELEVAPEKRRAALYDVVRAAQSFRTDKIRADALAAIEKLKRNPQQTSKKWYSAARIGQTALALGCVLAGATGHVELGIPCVVSGALSSAALKLWGDGSAATFFK